MRTATVFNFLIEATLAGSVMILLMLPVRRFLLVDDREAALQRAARVNAGTGCKCETVRVYDTFSPFFVPFLT